MGRNKGFTLLELVIVVALTAILMVTVFQALEKVKLNDVRVRRSKDNEKESYLLFHRLSDLFKNVSSYRVFNGRQHAAWFRGTVNSVMFLSRAPLISPNRSIHLVEIFYSKKRILYREKELRNKEKNLPMGFNELKDEPFYTLLEDVKHSWFSYYGWDRGVKDYKWRKHIDTYKNDSPPMEVMLQMTYHTRTYEFVFPKVIIDKNTEAPGDLFN